VLALIPLLPFAGFLVNATLGRRLPKSVSGGLASLVMLASFVISVITVVQIAGRPVEERAIQEVLYTWFASGDLNGTVAAHTVRFQSSLPTEGTRVAFQFSGTAEGGKMSGTVALGEYGEARWTAEKHQYRTGGGRRG